MSSARADSWSLPYLCWSGSDRERCLFASHSEGHGFQHTSRSWSRSCEGDAAERAHGRVVRSIDRMFPRTRRFNAPVLARDRNDGDKRHRGAVHAAGLRRRLQREAHAIRPCGRGVLWRRCRQQRSIHEALNMASIWKLPTLFICENNQYATEVPFSYSSGSSSVAGRAAGYGLTGVEVDGNDVLEIARIAVRLSPEPAPGRARH